MGRNLVAIVIFGVLALAGCRSMGVIESDAGQYYTAHDAKVRFTMRSPSGEGPFPAVILMHGCSGLGESVGRGMAQHADHLVDAGFVALILDSFTTRGIDSTCTSSRKAAESTLFRQHDAVHTLRHLQALPDIDPENVFLMGQSEGGSVAVKLAAHPLSSVVKDDAMVEASGQPWFAAIVAYYPWCPHVPKWLDTPLLVLSGEEDDWTPSQGCIWHKAVVKGAPYDVKIYEDAHHSFDLPMPVQHYVGYTVGGHPAAAADSRMRMIAWFREHMR
ncbi:MAG: dienelactone hydrolase family protein [bacterium]|nr:dienelactone hydrolase family protein [bacterium]MDE0239030.1 dienelactone hydrolase family protein [bacterium]MDE0416365.1 dienelactone hydrolase family protein [bacterium]